VSQNIKEHLL
jgi:hypothetical protein